MLIPGEPEQLNEKMPQGVNLNAFPTSFILGRDGRVRGGACRVPEPGERRILLTGGERSDLARREAARRGRTEVVSMTTSGATTTLRLSAAIVMTITAPLAAQSQRPQAEVAPVVETSPVRAGSPATIALHVRLPKDVHVQSNKPRDPSLIPTVLTLEAPAGIVVESIEYPAASDLPQPGRQEPLAVYGSEFAITVRLSLAAGLRAGEVTIPGVLRYQPCNDTVCFPRPRHGHVDSQCHALIRRAGPSSEIL